MSTVKPGPRAPERLRPPLSTAVWTLAVGGPVVLALLVSTTPVPGPDAWAIPAYTLVVSTWCVVGALIATGRPGNRVGWLILCVGLATATSLIGQAWAVVSATSYDRTLPGTLAGLWLSWLFLPALAAALLFTPLLFPDGSPPTRRWWLVGLLAAVGIGAQSLGTILLPGPLESFAEVTNPTGVEGMEMIARGLVDIGGTLTLATLPLSILAAVVRFRRGTPVERQQLKWFGSSISLAAFGLLGGALLPQPLGLASWMGMTVALGLVPVSIAVAILRYRLYEIDRIISRTLAYAAVTALLAAAFVVTNLALQAVLAGATGSSTLTTAAATLVVAGLFQPVRRRVQAIVDRRFN
ncbi:MAG TPA: hypothetical protein VKB30_04575, partial [Candidatus Limnocylindrales bacterium]|nr:hypothetical protein [Candidatus Limnocylindrales bacterium]